MSARNFYQTFYQTDQLFRLSGEPWVIAMEPSTAAETLTAPDPDVSPDELEQAPAVIDTAADVTIDLISELESLATQSNGSEPETLPVDHEVNVRGVTIAEPEPLVVIAAPEPLPQPAPRPTTPSILPPVQHQSRLPQLHHKVLVLADEELDPSNLLFLEKILKAVNLNINGVDLLNLYGARDMNFAELLQGKYINHFITFGVPFERINLDIMMDRYSPVRFEGITFLMADSLPTIEADQNLKKRLWAALQRVFLQRYA